MSYYNGPRIVTEGLVLCFDAANTKSYIGSGTSIKDLSTSLTGTLTNGPTFTSAYGGGISFDGADDYISVTNPLNQSTMNQEWTVSSWLSLASSPPNSAQYLVEGLNSGVAADWYAVAPLLYLNGGANDYYRYGSGGSYINTGIMNLTFRFKNSTGERILTRNDKDISGSGPNNTYTPSGQNGTFRIGYTMKGVIHHIQIYKRMLTNAEVLQNYNLLKSRFSS